MRKLLIVLLVPVVAVAAWFFLRRGDPWTVRVDAAEIEAGIARSFPIEKDLLLTRVELSDPRLILDPEAETLGLEVALAATGSGDRLYRGTATIRGQVAYRPGDGAFYLDRPVTRFDVEGLSGSRKEILDGVTTALAADYLAANPIYELREDRFRERMARIFLRDLEIERETIVFHLAERATERSQP